MLKFTKQVPAIYENKEGFEIQNDSRLDNDCSNGWSLWLDGEWIKDAKTKKELVKIASLMVMQWEKITLSQIQWDNQKDFKEPDWSKFNGIELGTCLDISENDEGTSWCRIDENEITGQEFKQAKKEGKIIHTIYGHCLLGGVEALIDFKSVKECLNLAIIIKKQDWFIKEKYIFVNDLIEES